MISDEGAAGRVGAGYDAGAAAYDELLQHNRSGAERLVAALPEGPWPRALDVGCGTGFASLAMARRFGTRDLVGVDVSQEMLARYRAALEAVPGTRVAVLRADAADMPVAPGSFDAVVSSMAFHWFPDKPAAVAGMARALRPGGALGLLASGRGADREFRDVLEAMRPPVPEAWLTAFDAVQRDEVEVEGYLTAAGLEPIDVWMERRRRAAPPERYLARMAVTTAHLSAGLDPQERRDLGERLRLALDAAAGPRGFDYTFTKVYAVARRPP